MRGLRRLLPLPWANTTIAALLNDHGVEFVSLKENYDTTSSQGKLFVTIMMALAEFEREQTAERTRDAALDRAERGLWNGGQLLGYDLDTERKGHLVPNEDEAAIVDFAFDAYLHSGSITEAADALNQRGLRTKSYTSRRGKEHGGRDFTYTTVQHMLKNRAYIGEKTLQDGRVIAAVWPGIVDPEKFQRAQELLARNGRTHRNGAREVRHVHILSHGLLRCGRCRSQMQGRSGTGKQGRVYFYYVCTNADCRFRVVASEVEDAVVERIGVLASSPETVAALTEKANKELLRERPEIEKRLRTLRRALKASDGEAGTLAKALVRASPEGIAGLNDQLARAAQRQRELGEAIAEAEGRLAELERARASAEAVRAGLANFKRVFMHLQPHEQQELVRLVLKQAEVGDRELVLELYGGALGAFEGKEKANPGVGFAGTPIWLLGRDSNPEPIG